MGRIRASRPSPAIIVAVLALVAALAGTAVAGPDATTSALSKKKVKKIATKQADKQIDERAPGLSVANSETLDGLDSTAFLRPSCPEGTLFHEGACVEQAARAARDFDAATAVCLNAQRRLPTVDELQTFRLRIPLSGEEWTSMEWDRDTPPPRALSVLPDGTTDGNSQGPGTTNPFRCVATWP